VAPRNRGWLSPQAAHKRRRHAAPWDSNLLPGSERLATLMDGPKKQPEGKQPDQFQAGLATNPRHPKS